VALRVFVVDAFAMSFVALRVFVVDAFAMSFVARFGAGPFVVDASFVAMRFGAAFSAVALLAGVTRDAGSSVGGTSGVRVSGMTTAGVFDVAVARQATAAITHAKAAAPMIVPSFTMARRGRLRSARRSSECRTSSVESLWSRGRAISGAINSGFGARVGSGGGCLADSGSGSGSSSR
jgi:hypothetical protein